MFQKLVSLNQDLGQLVDKGYAVGFDVAHLIVRDVPYLDASGGLHLGAIVTELEFDDTDHVTQKDHQILFAGGVPHEADGTPIKNLGGGTTSLALGDINQDVVVQRSFSNKPRETGKFANFFEKIESYVAIISGPAILKHKANPLTYRVAKDVPVDPIFHFQNTFTARAGISHLTATLNSEVIAVIGLGGTGAYLLDYLSKSAVREIRLFDFDLFKVHNAYRSPGRVDSNEFGKPKVEVYATRYANFRRGITSSTKMIDASSATELEGVTFAFVCVDKGSARAEIFDLLEALGIPFIDTGMGLNIKSGPVAGLIRTTYFSPDQVGVRRERNLVPLVDQPDDVYKANIQISELNAINAAFAMILFKQIKGFYKDSSKAFHLIFDITDLKSVGEC